MDPFFCVLLKSTNLCSEILKKIADQLYIKEYQEQWLSEHNNSWLCSFAKRLEIDEICVFHSDYEGKIIVNKFTPSKEIHDLIDATENTARSTDKESSFIIINGETLAAMRDCIGLIPIYFAQDKNIIAISNNRKSLWNIGLVNVESLHPGSIYYFRKDVIKKVPRYCFKRKKTTISIDEAVQELQNLLVKSIQKFFFNKEIVISFSGGLDSSILAKICKDLGINFRLYCFGVEGSKDIFYAKKSATLLGIPLIVQTITLDSIRKLLPDLIIASEVWEINSLAIALPLFLTARKTRMERFETVLTGQGADELYGGYQRYERVLKENGYETLDRMLFNDISTISFSSLERDLKVGMFHSVNVIFPYLDMRLIDFSINLPPNYKIHKDGGTFVRKFILRKVAQNLNMPSEIVGIPKIAAQYGSGFYKAILKIAKEDCSKPEFVNRNEYKNCLKFYFENIARSVGIPIVYKKSDLPLHLFSLKKIA